MISEQIFKQVQSNRERVKKVISGHIDRLFIMNIYQVTNIITSLAVSVAFARLSTKTVYGQYTFAISIVSLISLISMPGVRTTIFRSVSQGDDGFYKSATRFNFIWSLIGAPLLALTGFYLYLARSEALGVSIILVSFLFPLIYSAQNWKNLLKAKENFKSFVIYETSISILKAVLIIGLIFLQPENLIAILTAYFLVETALNTYFYFKTLHLIDGRGTVKNWKKEGYAYTLLEFSSYAFSKIDRILVGLFLPFSQVAIYNIAMKVTDTFFKFIKSSIEAVLPGFFQGKYKFSDFFPIFLILFAIPLLLYPIVEYPLIFLYSEDYRSSVFYAQIYLFAVPFYFMAYVSSEALIKERMDKEANISRLTALTIFVVITVILVPTLGILGAVIASLIYYPIQMFLALYYLHKEGLIQL